MPDLLIRDLSEAELGRLDARARALGLSRSEYVRRRLRQDTGAPRPTLVDAERFAVAHADLADPDVMAGAWR
ncbi:MAG: type II toxin-antitoxin system VapB family antitoxin [Solirubrobacteraceae bacterium]